jgi:hypothetical protein
MMSKYSPIPKPNRTPEIDVNNGFLCVWVYWRPDPKAPDPDMPGLKQHMTTFIRVQPEQACLCGSGKPYGVCCRLNRYWHPICPNPGMEGYSLLAWHSATFASLDREAVRERLLEEVRVHDIEDTPERSFWTYWGEPALEAEFGIMCFGDFELNRDGLLVTAMSELRMRVLLSMLSEIAGDCLGKPHIQREPVKMLDKHTGKYVEILPKQAQRRRRRR